MLKAKPNSNPWTPAVLAQGSLFKWVLSNVIVSALYFALGLVVSQFFAAYGLFPAPIWLPAGIATVAAMAGDIRMLPGIFAGSVLVNALLFAPPMHVTLIISLTNALGPVTGALLLRRVRPLKGLFTSFVGVIAFLLCMTFVSPAISAAGGAIGTSVGLPLDFAQLYSTWVNWWLTDSGGTLYLAPALILWFGLERENAVQEGGIAQKRFERRDLAVWAWIATVSIVLFLTPPLRGTYIRSAFPFLLVVPLSWIALKMSLRYAYTLVTLVAVVATAGTVAGFGPFQNHNLVNPLQLVGVLVVLLAMNVLTIVALFNERQEAQSASRVKSMFLANTSHELRTPLNAIIGYSSLISRLSLKPAALNNDVNEYADNIRTSGEHLLSLINDLLEMSKIEAGRIDLSEETLSLSQTIEDVLDAIRFQASVKSIALHIDMLGVDWTIMIDPKAWRQILLNLLSNAIKFTPNGGTVSINSQPGGGGDLLVRIVDTGIGIPHEALERIFIPFERVRDDRVSEIEGTGLGLSIARGLMTLHGGSITLESVVDKGTLATITLPPWRVLSQQSLSDEKSDAFRDVSLSLS